MKRIFALIGLILLFSIKVFSQTEIYEDINAAFNNSDQRLISKYFNSKVELTLYDQSNVYSKSQAEMVLRDFFSKYDVVNFQLLYKNNANGDASRFAIGTLFTKNGNFRIYFILKQVDGNLVLQEMRFEEERFR